MELDQTDFLHIYIPRDSNYQKKLVDADCITISGRFVNKWAFAKKQGVS